MRFFCKLRNFLNSDRDGFSDVVLVVHANDDTPIAGFFDKNALNRHACAKCNCFEHDTPPEFISFNYRIKNHHANEIIFCVVDFIFG